MREKTSELLSSGDNALIEIRRLIHHAENIAIRAEDMYALARISAARACLSSVAINDYRRKRKSRKVKR